jgi:quercetin dioxygenase-like cupin family protein
MSNSLNQTAGGSGVRMLSGAKFNFIISTKQTNNAFCVAEYEGRPGCEPPRHVHSREDEIFVIKEGTVRFYIGDEIRDARPGDIVHLPVNIPHHFKITSPVVKGLFIATPGNYENFFLQASQPVTEDDTPQLSAPTPEQVFYMIMLSQEYGVRPAKMPVYNDTLKTNALCRDINSLLPHSMSMIAEAI